NLLGHLIAGYILTTESDEADRIHLVPRTWDHHRVHRFSPGRIGHTEDGGFQDSRVLVEDFFDLGAIDILAAGDNHILGTINQENVALGIHATEIAAVIPPMTESVGSLLGFMPVALHDMRAAHDHFANLVRWQVVATGVDDSDINASHRLAARAGQ